MPRWQPTGAICPLLTVNCLCYRCAHWTAAAWATSHATARCCSIRYAGQENLGSSRGTLGVCSSAVCMLAAACRTHARGTPQLLPSRFACGHPAGPVLRTRAVGGAAGRGRPLGLQRKLMPPAAACSAADACFKLALTCVVLHRRSSSVCTHAACRPIRNTRALNHHATLPCLPADCGSAVRGACGGACLARGAAPTPQPCKPGANGLTAAAAVWMRLPASGCCHRYHHCAAPPVVPTRTCPPIWSLANRPTRNPCPSCPQLAHDEAWQRLQQDAFARAQGRCEVTSAFLESPAAAVVPRWQCDEPARVLRLVGLRAEAPGVQQASWVGWAGFG